MVEEELHALIGRIQRRRCEDQTVEVKSAHNGCPQRLYDTISAFSNQNSGGTIVFGLDEGQNYKKVGVYDAQDLQKKVMQYCEQMTPIVRPVLTVCDEEGLTFISAEIPPVDLAERPCFYTAKGRVKGSYVRVGDADKPMTEYEVYSYEAFRKRIQDDIRPAPFSSFHLLDQAKLGKYILTRSANRPNLSAMSQEQIYELLNITHGGQITLASALLFSIYPQSFYPQLSIIATCVPGIDQGVLDMQGHRFTDSKRLEGTLPEMLEDGVAFIRNNMKVSTAIDPRTGTRSDKPQYPLDAVREAILNALIHRDYSTHTESKPVQIIMFANRLEIKNPGGLYGRMTVDQLGQIQPDTRNPVLVTAMEALGETENRYSGIPRIRAAMRELALPEPVFTDLRGEFSVCLYNRSEEAPRNAVGFHPQKDYFESDDEKGLLEFCRTPRSRSEIIEHLAIPSAQYALRRYLVPLVESGAIRLTIPEKPRSSKQKYYTAF